MASPKTRWRPTPNTCLIDDDDSDEAIIKSEYNADVLPSNTQLAGAPIELVSVPRREMRLRTVLAPVVPLYDTSSSTVRRRSTF